MKQKKIHIMAMGITFLYIVAVWYKTGIFFDTNDDRLITEILSGVIANEPQAHTVYVNYWLALPLSLLYRITVNVPWYGGCLILFHILACGFMLDSAYFCCRNAVEYIVVTFVFIMLFFSYVCLLAQIQFTSTSALLAIAGYVCLVLNRNSAKRLTLFALFELFAMFLRRDAMLMIQPYGLAVCMGLIFEKKNYCWKEKVKCFGALASILLAVCMVAVCSEVIAYQDRGWKDYEKYLTTIERLFDYYGTPDYEEVRDILGRHHVSEAQYQAYCAGTMLDWDISIECGEDLAAYVQEHREQHPGAGELLEDIKNHFFRENHWKMNRLLVVAVILLVIYVVLRKSFYLLWPMLGLCGASTVIWGYLLWQGRCPNRVILPLFVCETIFILTMFFYDYGEKGMASWQKIFLLFCCAVFCYMGFSSGKTQYYFVAAENEGKNAFMEGMWELQDYCRSHPEMKYLIESVSLSYYTGSALETRTAQQRNSIVTGCWYSNSPPMRRKLQMYLGEATDFSLIIFQDGYQEQHPAVRYLTELCGSSPVCVDELTLSHGGSYAVYHFEKQQAEQAQVSLQNMPSETMRN